MYVFGLFFCFFFPEKKKNNPEKKKKKKNQNQPPPPPHEISNRLREKTMLHLEGYNTPIRFFKQIWFHARAPCRSGYIDAQTWYFRCFLCRFISEFRRFSWVFHLKSYDFHFPPLSGTILSIPTTRYLCCDTENFRSNPTTDPSENVWGNAWKFCDFWRLH